MLRALSLLLACALCGAGCRSRPAPPELAVDARAVTVTGVGIESVLITDADGLVRARREVPGLDTVRLDHGLGAGDSVIVALSTRDGSHRLEAIVPHGGLHATIDAPAGQGARVLQGELPFTVVRGASVQASLLITSDAPEPVALQIGDRVDPPAPLPAGRVIVTAPLATDRPTPVIVRQGDRSLRASLIPEVIDLAEARRRLVLRGVTFPATAEGAPELARPPDRIQLPTGWWQALLRRTGLGIRGRDHHTAWGFIGVRLANTGAAPLNVVVRARVLDAAGEPAAAFRPRVRIATGDTGVVSALLRVPAGGEATATLPIFVSDALLAEGASRFTRAITVSPLGSDTPLWTDRAPLVVTRGSTWVSLGFALALLGALGGAALTSLRLGRWIAEARTADLTTVAVFSTLAFLTSTAAAVVSTVLGMALGPFQTFATGLIDDALRYALLATLVSLLPRPGVLALSVLVTWLLRGVALGGFSPTDVLFVGGQILWLELGAWAAGLTRSPGWRDDPAWARWARLSLGFGAASLLTSLSGLALGMVLYRLYYAGWYVAATLALPGFVYVLIACALATRFAASLREVSG